MLPGESSKQRKNKADNKKNRIGRGKMQPYREISEEERKFVEWYKKEEEHKYEKPSVTADIAIFSVFGEETEAEEKPAAKKLKLLLIKRGSHPCKDMYALPGGFVNPDETIDQAAERELKEETGIDCGFLEQIRTFSEPGRDPRGWTITGSYLALIDASKYKIQAGDDAKEAAWFEVSMKKDEQDRWDLQLKNGETVLHAVLEDTAKAGREVYPKLHFVESENIAFDHGRIIAYSVLALRQWLNMTRIAFRLLPEKFTLTELQQVYEAVQETTLQTAEFRRKMEEFVENTGEMKESEGNRPSRLFREK